MKKIIRLIIFSCLTVLSFNSLINAKALIWDIGYTLFKAEPNSIASQLGYWDCLCMYFKHGSGCSKVMKELFVDILSDGNEETDELVPRDPEGRPLPKILRDWFKGTRTSEEVLKDAVKRWEKYSKFEGKRSRRVILNTLQWMFDPWLFAASMKPILPAVKLVRDCARATNSKGEPQNSFYILSNLDGESFASLYKKRSNKSVFKYFKPQNIYISGFIRDLKPYPSIFKYLLRRSKLNPADCIFIDDQIENVKTAKQVGMTAIHLKDGDYHAVRQELKKLGVL